MRRAWTFLAILVPVAIVATADGWIVSAGRWTTSHTYSARTDELAESLRHGRASLLEPPPPELVALSNPYDAKANRAFREQGAHDLALFRGRYYLYWGPVPALLLAAAKSVLRIGAVGDQHVAYAFSLLELLASAALLHLLRSRYFSRSPRWTLSLAVLAVGLITPMPFMLARASAYEVAIIAGQFFLVCGIYFALRSMYFAAEAHGAQKRQFVGAASAPSALSQSELLLCGVCWAAALGSRISLAPWVAVMCLAVLYVHRQRLVTATLACVPVGLAVVALLAYNRARFGSFGESGVRYMLASNSAQRAILSGHMFGVRYLPSNLINYLLTPPNVQSTFPFVTPKIYGMGLLRRHFEPRYYHVNTVAGVVATSPFLLLAVVPPLVWLRERRWKWITVALSAAGFVAATGPVLLLFNCTMRYLGDWTPSLVVLAAIGWWTIDARGNRSRRMWHGAIVVAIIYSCAVGVLLAVTGYTDHFKLNNPEYSEAATIIASVGSSRATSAAA